jgi:hypothetical protein
MYKKALSELKKALEERLLEILEEADLREDYKEKILNLEFGSLHYRTYKTKIGGKEYDYHHLSGNLKNPNTGKWTTIGLKNLRRKPEWLETLPAVYNSLKKVDDLIKTLDVIGLK